MNEPTPDDRIAELVVRHYLGQYRKRPAVQQRLDELFAANPPIPGTFDLLLRACEHLDVTGRDLEGLGDLAVERKIAADLATATTETAEHHHATSQQHRDETRQPENSAT